MLEAIYVVRHGVSSLFFPCFFAKTFLWWRASEQSSSSSKRAGGVTEHDFVDVWHSASSQSDDQADAVLVAAR